MNKEQKMYEILQKRLEEQRYRVKKKVKVDTKEEEAGQTYIALDVVAYKEGELWDIECKVDCTIEMFSFTLGQVIGYKTLLDHKEYLEQVKRKIEIDKVDKIKFSVAMLATEKCPFRDQLGAYKTMLKEVRFPMSFLVINEKTEEILPPNFWEKP